MTARRISLFAVSLALAIVLGYFGYYLYDRYITFSTTINADSVRAAGIAQNRTRVLGALGTTGVSPQQATRGFWYSYTDAYGNDNVAYFNPDEWALQNDLTDQQIAAMAATVSRSHIVDRDAMRDVPQSELPPTLQFHNQLYQGQAPGQFASEQSQLEDAYAKGTASADDLWKLSYMYELQGDYGKRDEVNAASCKLFKARCAGDIPITIHGRVVDLQKRPIESARVTLLSHSELKPAVTNDRGEFSITLSAKQMEKVRLSAMKRNFSEGVASVIVIGADKTDYQTGDIVLGSPISIVTIDTRQHTVTDPNDEAHADGSFVIHTSNSTYEIPAGAIKHADGKSYDGPIDVYLYEFTRQTIPQNLATLDTFDQVIGYAGDLMQTFGMPYIQFFSPDGEELHVLKSKPMLLTYKIAGMQDLRNNTDGFPTGKLTDADMQELIAASKGDPGFPITRDFIVHNHLLMFPPFWVFDRKKGVWTNEGIRVLDMDGIIQSLFYTINDQ